MAGPWHPCDMVNKSGYVALPPLGRLAVRPRTGNSVFEQLLTDVYRSREENI
jgi:hypothetical protein